MRCWCNRKGSSRLLGFPLGFPLGFHYKGTRLDTGLSGNIRQETINTYRLQVFSRYLLLVRILTTPLFWASQSLSKVVPFSPQTFRITKGHTFWVRLGTLDGDPEQGHSPSHWNSWKEKKHITISQCRPLEKDDLCLRRWIGHISWAGSTRWTLFPTSHVRMVVFVKHSKLMNIFNFQFK